MILTCPNCSSRFLLSAQTLAPKGRRVKCSNCTHEWFQEPDPDELIDNLEHEIEDIPEAIKPVPEGASVPALHEDTVDQEGTTSKAAIISGYLAAFLVFLAVLVVLIISKPALLKSWPASAAIYELLGMQVKAPGEGLEFDRIKANLTTEQKVLIEGMIVNLTDKEQPLPFIEASIRDAAGRVIQKTSVKPPYDQIKAEATLPFKTLYNGPTKNADHLHIRFVLPESITKTAQEGPVAKNVSKGGDNNQAPPGGGSAETHAGESH